ncbi:amidase domain-containing protein [Bacillus cereus]|nr:amidase domain-containing protein [Bacillus cereus]MEC2757393.1 amidase domain-containing protein [Bacillus cereus]MEC2824683.1 amidase domain-containing protein [Bacillus cereus]
MKKSKILLGLGIACTLTISSFEVSYAQEVTKKSEQQIVEEKKQAFTDTTYDSFTLGQAEDILFDYLKRNNLSYEMGSKALRDYLFDQLMYEKDENLKTEKHYRLILAYAANYISENEGKELLNENQQSLLYSSGTFNMDHLANKTLKQIKNENEAIQTEKKVNQKSNGIQYAVPPEGGFNVNTAVSYAARHAGSTSNDTYGYYGNGGDGGDCTNYISQIIQAGGKSINRPSTINMYTPNTSDNISHWYNGVFVTIPTGYSQRKVTTSWIRVVDFYKYWTKRLTYFDTFSENSVWKGSAAGDVVQYKETSSGTMWHTVFVIKKTPDGPRIAQHSPGKFDTPIVLPVTSSYSVLKFSQS